MYLLVKCDPRCFRCNFFTVAYWLGWAGCAIFVFCLFAFSYLPIVAYLLTGWEGCAVIPRKWCPVCAICASTPHLLITCSQTFKQCMFLLRFLLVLGSGQVFVCNLGLNFKIIFRVIFTGSVSPLTLGNYKRGTAHSSFSSPGHKCTDLLPGSSYQWFFKCLCCHTIVPCVYHFVQYWY